MTNKSIGNFLAELRKEKGITQRDLADYLGVSDKTISHWECDKYSPDISVIPILAEYFGVTCDELLKGERKVSEERENITCETAEEPKLNVNNFSYDPLVKESEFKKFAKIRLQNSYTKLKTSMVITAFVSTFSIAIPWTIIWFLEYENIIKNALTMLPYIIFFAVCLFLLLSYLSYQKFKTVIISCNADETELKHWKRKGASVVTIPFILCLIVLLLFIYAIFPVNTINPGPTEPLTAPPTMAPTSNYSSDYSYAPSSPVQSYIPNTVEPTTYFYRSYDQSQAVVSSSSMDIFTD